MPIIMAPPQGSVTTTKDVTPFGLEESGPNREYFTIRDFLDAATNKLCRDGATTTTTNAKGVVLAEKIDNTTYSRLLVREQLTGWRLIVPPGYPFDAETMYREDGNYFWQFTPATVATLPEAVVLWLGGEIAQCGGVIATESLLVTTDSGQVLDFRRAAEIVPGRREPEVPDPLGDAAVSGGSPGDSPA